MPPVADEIVQAGREALRRRAWEEAYELLSSADGPLSAEDREALADAAYWSGRAEDALRLREQAYRSYLEEENTLRAASLALRLSLDYAPRGAMPVSSGWLAKAMRLLEDEPESREHGEAELVRSLHAQLMGKLGDALEHAERAFELGKRFARPDIQALALVAQGTVLLYQGELDRGLVLLDEASTSVLSGELDPFSASMVYCMTISGCSAVGDVERARQWTDVANRWWDEDVRAFSGECRVHRSEVLWLEGRWDAAEKEAVDAGTALEAYNIWAAAAAHYHVAEIRRRRGDFAKAETAYRKARALGREPQPGHALLQLAQGKAAEAEAALRRSLAADQPDLFARARRLPAQVEISLAVGNLDAARAAADELEEIADRFRVNGARTPLLDGSLGHSRALIAVTEEDWPAAEAAARRAIEIWTRVGAPYETAAARMLLGKACEHTDDPAGARAEYELAKEAFERLGAVLDLQRTKELLGVAAATRRTFLFTDIVDSTKLLDALGDEKWKRLLDRHDALVEEAIRSEGGEVIKHTGDGFFAAFDAPASAVEAAVRVQRALDDEFVSVRIGIHSGNALERGSDYTGRGVNVAARIGALGAAGEILASTETLDGVALRYPASGPRAVELKGFEEPLPVAALLWR